MAMREEGFEELMNYFSDLQGIEKDKTIINSVKEGAEIMLKSQKEELSSSGLATDVVEIKKAKKSKDGGIGYKIGMQRGGKEFSDPSSPNFDKYRSTWFHYFGFNTLKKWSKSKRKNPDIDYPRRRPIKQPPYHAPDPWLDRAFDKSIDKTTIVIKDALIKAMDSKK